MHPFSVPRQSRHDVDAGEPEYAPPMRSDLPLVVLHDHIDGGLRVDTVIRLARERGLALPTYEPDPLSDWFDQSRAGSLDTYLEAFRHTVGVMQTEPALERVTSEAVRDLITDGVFYAELRFAPLLHTEGGLRPHEAIEAVLRGMGERPSWGLILTAMRHQESSHTVADLAILYAGHGVVGFDLAGPEEDYPASLHQRSIDQAKDAGLGITLHAGEAGGVGSIDNALSAGAHRIGHGVDIIDDCRVEGGTIIDTGRVAGHVLEAQIPLEVCPSSNLATKRWSIDQHPVGVLHRAGFNVLLSTDNRLMSKTSMSREVRLVEDHHGLDEASQSKMMQAAINASFSPSPELLLAVFDTDLQTPDT